MSENGIREASDECPVHISTPAPGSLAAQIIACAMSAKPAQKQRFNPRPPGVIQQGSATDAVLAFLRESYRFHTMAQIIWKTGKSHSAVSWALIRLRQWGRVEAIEDPCRNSRYYKYRAKKGSEA